MATHIQLVLQEDVDNLGRSGDLVRVRPGYARNYLLPRGLASVATHGNVARIEHDKRLALAKAEKARAGALGEASKLEGLVVRISMAAGEEGKLYGSVTAQDVVDALHAQHKVEVDRRKLKLPGDQPLKVTGAHAVTVKLASDVIATFSVEVAATVQA